MIEGLDTCGELKLLDVGSNRIERIAGLNSNPQLQELWLGKNRISVIEGLEGVPLLTRLDIQVSVKNDNIVVFRDSQANRMSRRVNAGPFTGCY